MDIQKVADDHLLCRDPGFRHRWEPQRTGGRNVFESGKERGELVRRAVCERCGTTREEVFRMTRSTVEKVRNRYVYADGYVLKDGTRIHGAEVWRERFRRGF
jgi:hypothetical protein